MMIIHAAITFSTGVKPSSWSVPSSPDSAEVCIDPPHVDRRRFLGFLREERKKCRLVMRVPYGRKLAIRKGGFSNLSTYC